MEPAWIWLALGVALVGAEVLTGTFIILFFGVGAIFVSFLSLLGLDRIEYQIVSFGLSSLILMILFRKKFLLAKEKKSSSQMSSDVHKTLTLSETIPVGGQATIEYQGAPWTAVNASHEALEKGSLVRIVQVDGIKILLAPVNSLEEGMWKLSQ